jgi:hypothetical protein
MKPLGNEAYLDAFGQLYLERPGKVDLFDPPGTLAQPVITPTGFTFELVKTYGWLLGQFWDNNPLQFATAATADKMELAVGALGLLRLFKLGVSQKADEVRVGPFTWAPIRKVDLFDADGTVVSLNAGELANQMARYQDGWRDQIERTIRAAMSAERSTI